ncbi:MAG: ATP--guanido phosphotransferase [Lentisphaerae bacterium]|nr:ATP--guanido phosphotransferase [Lentisphaerota bacterium]
MMNRDIDCLLKNPASFLSAASSDGICISSRIRLARNLAVLPFPSAANLDDSEQAAEAIMAVCRTVSHFKETGFFFDVAQLDEMEKLFLLERRLAVPELIGSSGFPALAVSNDGSCAVMINAGDHLRMQALMPGLQLEECWRKVSALDDELADSLEFAWNDESGYLTASPADAGTGMRASVMLHLPGLVMSEQIAPTIEGVNVLGCSLKKVYDDSGADDGAEGYEDSDNGLYLLSNKVTLGESEENIIEQLSVIVRQIVEYERRARRNLLHKDRFTLLDHVGRAYGMLQCCYRLPADEAVDALSALRLGVDMGLFKKLKIATVNELYMELNSGHLQMRSGLALPEEDLEILRAKLFRTKL